MPLIPHPRGDYLFLPGISPYSCGALSPSLECRIAREEESLRVNEIGALRTTSVNRRSAFFSHYPRSPKSLFFKAARNFSRIFGVNELSSASARKPASINSEGMEDKTLKTVAK